MHSLAVATDARLLALWQQAGLPNLNPLCLLAVGGYGRRELYPYSDIDIVILIPETMTPPLQRSLERFVQSCWDQGLLLSQIVNTITNCAHLARTNIHTFTSL